MITDISIALRDNYTINGEFDCQIYELRVEEDGEWKQRIDLSDGESLIVLVDALNHYIAAHNLDHRTKPYNEE